MREPPLREITYMFESRLGKDLYRIYWRAILNEPEWSWFQVIDERPFRTELDEHWYQIMLKYFAVERAESVLGFWDLQHASPHKIMRIREVLESRSGFVRPQTPIGCHLSQGLPESIYNLPQFVR